MNFELNEQQGREIQPVEPPPNRKTSGTKGEIAAGLVRGQQPGPPLFPFEGAHPTSFRPLFPIFTACAKGSFQHFPGRGVFRRLELAFVT